MRKLADSWDRFVDGARVAADSIADAAGDIYQRGRRYVNTKRIEAQLKDSYALLGKLHYQRELEAKTDDPEISKLVDAIGRLRDELRRAGEQKQSYEFAACKACGLMISKDSKFCHGCGAKTGE